MKKIIFLDRDGTIIVEPQSDKQVDSFDKLSFIPGVLKYLEKINNELGYSIVLVTNQDGLGTDSFPQENFWPVQNFIVNTLKNENINLMDVLIDSSFEHQKLETRKPGLGMVYKYINDSEVDLKSSFVIGDRDTDIIFANNLGCNSIHFSERKSKINCSKRCSSWKTIYDYLKGIERKSEFSRVTKETNIKLKMNLDGSGLSNINTGLSFFDHMLDQLSKHSLVDIDLNVVGDLGVDEHHTIEDTAILLGEAFNSLLSNKIGINRYGFVLPMDDCLAQCAIDFGGRSWITWSANFKREKIGDVPTEMFFHFFKSFADTAKANINIKAEGKNEHHKIESIFKAFAKSIKSAIMKDESKMILPTTKGII